MRSTIKPALLLALTLCGFIIGQAAAEEKTPIKLGVVIFLSGDWAQAGNAFREGIALAEIEANQAGGIDPHPVKVIYEDSAYEQRRALTAARKLTGVDHVVASVVGTLHEAKTAGPIFEANKTPAIVLWDSSVELEQMGDYIFGIGTWAPSTTECATDFALKRLQVKNAALVFSNTEWAETVAREFKTTFLKAGGVIKGEVSVNPGQTDFRAEILRLRAMKADFIYAPIDDNVPAFFRQLAQANLNTPILTADNLTDELMAEFPAAFEGVYQTQVADPDNPEARHLTELYKNNFKRDPKMLAFTAWGYDGMKLLIEQARKCGSDAQKIKDCLYQVRDFPGASGPISFNAAGSSPKPVSVFRVQAGKLKRNSLQCLG